MKQTATILLLLLTSCSWHVVTVITHDKGSAAIIEKGKQTQYFYSTDSLRVGQKIKL